MFRNGGLHTMEDIPVSSPEVNVCPISDEIKQLQLRIFELETQKKERDENAKKTSIDHNLKVIHDLVTDKKKDISNNRYSTSVPLAKYYDQQLVTHLDAIYNILQILDERLTKIEEK